MQRLLPFLLCGLFFLGGCLLYSGGLGFPPYYHPDEINKVLQLQQHERNFHHPLLMLNSAAVLYAAGGSPQSTLATAALTRRVSVLFAAATVALLSFAAFLLAGPVAQICCGWLVLSEPQLFELAHYLKEDPALAMGFAVIYLAFLLWERRPSRWAAAVVGLAGALAISAKYIGIYPALLALLGVALVSKSVPTSSTKGSFWICLGTLLLGLAVINWQMIVEFPLFRHGLGREVALFHKKDATILKPKVLGSLLGDFGYSAWFALAAWLAVPLYQRRKLLWGEWLILISTFGYAILVLLSSREASRYLLPVNVSINLVIAVAVCWVAGAIASRVRISERLLQCFCCLAVIIVFDVRDFPAIANLNTGFHTDSRLQLIAYLRQNLPPHAVLGEDTQAKLPSGTDVRRDLPGWNLSQKIIAPATHAHLGDEFTLADLRARGVTHVVILLDGTTESLLKRPDKKAGADDLALQAFLADLQIHGQLLWSCPGGSPDYVDPALRLFSITDSATPKK